MTNDEMTFEAHKQIVKPFNQTCTHIWRASVRSEKKCACVRTVRCCLYTTRMAILAFLLMFPHLCGCISSSQFVPSVSLGVSFPAPSWSCLRSSGLHLAPTCALVNAALLVHACLRGLPQCDFKLCALVNAALLYGITPLVSRCVTVDAALLSLRDSCHGLSGCLSLSWIALSDDLSRFTRHQRFVPQ